MNIGDKVEVSLSGRVVMMEEDFWDTKNHRILYKIRIEDGPLSYTITVPKEAMVQEVAP